MKENKNHLLPLGPKDIVMEMRQVLYNCTFEVQGNKLYVVQIKGHREIFIILSFHISNMNQKLIHWKSVLSMSYLQRQNHIYNK